MATVTGSELGLGEARQRRGWRGWWAAGLAVVALLAAGAWLWWRFTAPVQVTFTADIGDLPFGVEIIPPVLMVQPGEVVSITYRIRNNDITPISAFGRLEIGPQAAQTQMYVYITQCGGLNTYQNAYVDDYEVVFRVEPAGLWGTSHITVDHVFTRSTPQ